jgi:hypothetical protein
VKKIFSRSATNNHTKAESADKKYLSVNICAAQQKVNRVQRDIQVENFNEFLRMENLQSEDDGKSLSSRLNQC